MCYRCGILVVTGEESRLIELNAGFYTLVYLSSTQRTNEGRFTNMAYHTDETNLPDYLKRMIERLHNQDKYYPNKLNLEDFDEDERDFLELLRFRLEGHKFYLELDDTQRGTVSSMFLNLLFYLDSEVI